MRLAALSSSRVSVLVLVASLVAPSTLAMPDLVVESVDSSGLQHECETAAVSGTVTVLVRNDGTESVRSAPRILLFEDRDLDGRYAPQADVLLAELPFSPPGPLSRTTARGVGAAHLVPARTLWHSECIYDYRY